MAICKDKPATAHDAYIAMERSIAKIAHQFTKNNRQDFDDLFSEGCKGLMEAFNRYDPSCGMAFSSYAYQWAWACIKDQACRDWKKYNNTSSVEIDDNVMGEDGYDMDITEAIDMSRRLEAMDEIDRTIVTARSEGYNFREISETLSTSDTTLSLHQVRNRYISALES